MLFMLAVTASASAFPLSATEIDSEGYPLFYLKGQNYGNWNSLEWPMTREGNVYSITVETLSGEFKLSDDDWTLNFGKIDSCGDITGVMSTTGLRNAPNFIAQQPLNNVTITMIYDKENPQTAPISFTLEGETPTPPPAPEGISGTLPVLYINVTDEWGNLDNEIIDYNLSHKNYFSGSYWLDLNDCEWMEAEGAKSIGSADEPLPLEIKARGNWTRTGFSKKPFKLKLGKKQSLLGLSKSKHFAILAHADDSMGYLRNFTGFNLGHRIGLPWTPSQQPVEVVINGNYRGLYFLTESIRVDEERVNIKELNDAETDLSLISGGYLVELDNYNEPNDSQIRMPELGDYPGYKDMLRITFDTPEVYSEEQRMFITDQFTTMNCLVGSNSDELWGYIDLDDLARYYLVCEIESHVEAFHGSTYLYRDYGEGQKWHFSPLWDMGNAFNGPTDGYIYDNAPYGMTWIGSITYNEKFNEKVRSTWKWFMSNGFKGIYEDMATMCDRIAQAAIADHKRWGDAPVPDGGISVRNNSNIQGRLNRARELMQEKIEWLKSRFGDYDDSDYPEPDRDDTPAAPLPNYILTGNLEVKDSYDASASRIYTLQGIRVNETLPGQVYLIVSPEGTRKIYVRK